MRIIKDNEEFNDILFSDQIDLESKDKEYKKEDVPQVLLEFNTAPYDNLIENIRTEVYADKKETYTKLYLRYKDSGETWEIGYVEMDLDFWLKIENVFYNYKPKFYRIHSDHLKELQKMDYINTVKFRGSELDGFIE